MSEAGEAFGLLTKRRLSEQSDEAVAPGEVFAAVTGQRTAQALEFIRADGTSFTVPYAYAPLLWWDPPGSLILEYPGLFSVAIMGHCLDELQRRIRDRRVLWVREIPQAEAEALPFAVTSIAIVHAFPSRDGM